MVNGESGKRKTANGKRETANAKRQSAIVNRQTENVNQQFRILPTSYFLLPASCFLLPNSCFLLPTSYSCFLLLYPSLPRCLVALLQLSLFVKHGKQRIEVFPTYLLQFLFEIFGRRMPELPIFKICLQPLIQHIAAQGIF